MLAEHGFSVGTVNDLNHDLNDTSVNGGCGGGGVNGDCSISQGHLMKKIILKNL